MKFKTLVASFAGIILFLAGVLLEMTFSSSVLWGEIETRVYTSQSSSFALAVQCPLALAFDERGTVSATITNSINEDVLPVVVADISRKGAPLEFSETLTLAPHESKTVTWNVDASNMIFGRLILVSVLQMNYSDLPSHQGYCAILLLHILGLNGRQSLILLCSVSLLCLILGSVIWLRVHHPLNERDKYIAGPFGALAVLATLALITAFLRWWGLIIFLDGMALMLIGVIFTEVLFNPRQRR